MKHWLIISLLFMACSKEQRNDCVTSAGGTETIKRQVDQFDMIYAEDKLDVSLIQDSTLDGTIEITGPKNLLPQIKTEIRDGQLRLTNTNTCNFVRSFNIRFQVRVYFSDLSRIETYSAAEISNEGILHLNDLTILHVSLSDLILNIDVKNEVYVNSFNSAKTILNGNTKVLKGSIEEASSLDARNLVAEEVLLDQHSPVDCFIDGTKLIYVKIFNVGNIYYVREPSDLKELNYRRSSGDLKKI